MARDKNSESFSRKKTSKKKTSKVRLVSADTTEDVIAAPAETPKLTRAEHERIISLDYGRKYLEQEIKLANAELKSLDMQLQIALLKFEEQKRLTAAKIESLNKRVAQETDARKTFFQRIADKHGIEGKFGYNPDTLEIIRHN